MNKEYEIEVYGLDHEQGDGFIAVYPDFPHIKGDGDTPQEAIESAKKAFAGYISATSSAK